MSDNRNIVYFDSSVEAWVYRASAVGKSLRCLAAARQGEQPLPAPEYLELAAEAGHRYEIVVKARLREQGYRISGEQGEIDLPVHNGVVIRGHLDGAHCLAPGDPTDRMLEVKSMSDRVYKTWSVHQFDRFPEYAAQLTTYMHAEGERRGLGTYVPATYAVVNRDTDEMMVLTFDHPPMELLTIIQKVMLSEQFAKLEKLPACDSASQYACPFDYLCDRHEVLFEEIEEGQTNTMIHLGEEYMKVLETEKRVADEKNALRDEIRRALGVRSEVKVPGFSFTNKAPKPAKKLDLGALRQHMGPKLDEFFTEEERDPVLRITPVKKKGNR